MSNPITPPKYFAALKEREEASLLTRLEALAERWERHAANLDAHDEDKARVRLAFEECYGELRDLIEEARA